jgi:hypothetical protein
VTTAPDEGRQTLVLHNLPQFILEGVLASPCCFWMLVGVFLHILRVIEDTSLCFLGGLLQLSAKALDCVALQAPKLLHVVIIRLEVVTAASMLRVEEKLQAK